MELNMERLEAELKHHTTMVLEYREMRAERPDDLRVVSALSFHNQRRTRVRKAIRLLQECEV